MSDFFRRARLVRGAMQCSRMSSRKASSRRSSFFRKERTRKRSCQTATSRRTSLCCNLSNNCCATPPRRLRRVCRRRSAPPIATTLCLTHLPSTAPRSTSSCSSRDSSLRRFTRSKPTWKLRSPQNQVILLCAAEIFHLVFEFNILRVHFAQILNCWARVLFCVNTSTWFAPTWPTCCRKRRVWLQEATDASPLHHRSSPKT